MFRATHWQAIQAKVSYHFGHGFKGTAELAEYILAGIIALYSHVHEAFGTSAKVCQLINHKCLLLIQLFAYFSDNE